jgi:hypothetical protein
MQPTPEHLMKGLQRRAQEGFQGYPLAVVAFYGHNDKIATKAVIGIIKKAGGSPESIKKWIFEKGDLRKDVTTIKELFRHIEAHQALSVALTPGIYSCPHEAGIDFPEGDTCPQCTFWSNIKKPDLFKTANFSATQDQSTRILRVLTEAARNKKTLPYGDVMKSMGLAYQDAMHRRRFKKDLRVANRQSELHEHGLLISALLVYKTQYIPDDDFFLMAQEQGMFTPGKDSKTAFFKDHLERIFNFYEEKEGYRTLGEQ